MVAEIARAAGFHNTYLHLGRRRLQAYDGSYLKEGLLHPRKFDVACRIEESRKLVRRGELAMSHVEYTDELARNFAQFKILSVSRELRTTFVSWARFLLHSERYGPELPTAIRKDGIAGFMRIDGAKKIRNALNIHRWSEAENVLALKMEQIISDPGAMIQAMLVHLDCTPALSPLEIWAQASGADTLTKSLNYPKLEWTEKDELVFRELGGPDANRKLGYEEQESHGML